MSLNKVMKKFMAIALSVFLLTTQCSWSFATIGSWSDFKDALESGISDDLSANISYNGTSQITANKNATIDLGNHTITGTGSNKNAIQATANNLRFIDGTFTGFNRTTEWGSILHLTTNGNVTFDGTRFLNNSSLEAGALSSGTKGSHLTIQNALFQGNSANAIGAVGAFTGTTIENTIFRNNNSTDNTGAYDESGGALFLGAVSTTDIGNSVNGSTFENNTSGTSGGAIATRRADLANNSAAKLDIVNTTFTSNVAGTQGGAIDNYFYNDSANSGAVKVASSAFTSNTAADGGAIYNHGELDKAGNAAAMHIVDSTFTGNHATNLGGAIFNAGTLVLSGTNSFSNNYDGYGTDNQRKNDIYNTGFLEINGTAILDGGIHGDGEVDVKGNISFTENADIEQETFVVEEGKITENAGTASFEQLQGDGTFQNTGTLNLDLSNTGDYSLAHLVDGSTPVGQTNIHVGAGKTVEITPTEFVQKKVVTTGEGHLRVAGDIEAEFENQMTGTSVEIASLIDGPFTNIAGANAEFVDGAAITGLITNNGTIGIYNTTNYNVQANMTGNSSAVPANILNIGGEYNSIQYTSNVSVGKAGTDSDIANQTINVVDGTLTLFDGGAKYGSITNSVLNILADGAVAANASKIDTVDDTIANAGSLTFTGGTNANVITGAGDTSFTGDATNNAAITQATVTNSANLINNALITAAVTNTGDLTSNASNIVGPVANTGDYNITGGTNNSVVTGDGDTNINGDLTNLASISQDHINVMTGVVVTSSASDLTATTGINNAGVINYTAGTTANTIVGGGRIDITGYVTNTGSIDQKTVTNSGVFTNNGSVNANLKNTNEIEGTGDLITKTGISSNTGTIEQNSLTNKGTFDNSGHITLAAALANESTGVFNTNADLISANGIVNQGAFNITGGTLVAANEITGSGTTNFTGDATNNAAITQTTVTNSANLTNNAVITAEAITNTGTLTSLGNNINGALANSGTYNLTNGDNAVAITGTGTTNILGTTSNSGTITQDKVVVGNVGNFTTSANTVTAAIENQGTMTWNGGTSNNNAVTGDGKLNITGGTIANNAAISQDKITIAGGILTTNADLLATANGIVNDTNGGLVLTGGTNNNAITGLGVLVSNGNVFNQASIAQDSMSVNGGTFTSDASLLAFAHGITNDSNISLTGGTNTNTIEGTGTTYIDGNVENTGTIKTNIGVGTSGYYATSSDVEKVLANNGVVDLQNGADITSTGSITGSGTTNILGLTLNDGTITQSNLNIASNGIFYTDIGDVTASINNEGEMFWDGSTAVNNDNVVSGTGAVTITGGSDVNNRAAISQSKIIIDNGSLTSNADLLSATESIYNDDVLTFTGGTNTNAIGGTGSMSINGNVINLAAVTQDDLSIDGGKFTTDAGSLTIANGITLADNTGLSFTGGDNTNDISGTGMVYIDGTVQNEADIQTKITVNTGAHYGTATDVYKKLDNRGTTDLVDADVLASGKISGTGTTNILGTTVVEDGASIEQTALNISANGSLTTNSQSVTAAVANDGDLIWNGGEANGNVITGTGSLTINNSGKTITNSASISQDNITITNGTLKTNADLLTSANGIANEAGLTFTGGTNTNVITSSADTGAMNIMGEVINTALIEQDSLTVAGTADFTNSGAHISVTDKIVNNGLFTNEGGLITGAVTNVANASFITDGTGVDGDITNNGDYYITDGDNDNKITGAGNLYIQGSTTNTEVVTQEKMTIANGATFVATDMDDVTLNTAIDNAGTLEMQSGTNSNKIQGTTGTLNVTGAVTHAAGKTINQDTINIATLGEFTIEDIDDVTTVDGIASTGKLILQGEGINLNDISGTGNIQVDAAGVITNQGNMEQTSLDNDGKFTSDADLLAFANGIDNSNELNLTGGTNENVITNATGTTNFKNDVVNNAAITQATVTNAAGTLTNNADIKATTFTNDTGTVNNEAVISAAITNNVGGTLNSTADNLAGAVVNDGTLNVAGGVVFDTITGTGDMYINDDLINDEDITQTNITNSANFTNSGAISATLVTNSGVIDNTETITATNKIDNTEDGTINSKADYLNAAVSNAGIVNLAGGTTQNDITGTGDTNVTADLTLAHLIDQATITNAEGSTITGKASNLVATNEINNSGTLAFNAASTGSSKINGTGNVEVTADTILTAQNDYEGGTLIGNAAGLLVAGQKNIGSGDVTFAGNGYLAVGEAGTLTSNLLGATATDDIKVINTDALTVEGSINDAADFHKDGVGDMTFAMASNSYAGDTYVDDGKLIGNAQNINNAVLGKAGTTVEFNDTVDAELNEINTLGTFVKSGSALLNVQNNSFTALQADINKGIFAANTALTATTMNVNNGATLRGNGNITGTVNVNNGATIAPGNSIDTLTITGDLNLAGGSTTAIEINETPASDKIVVTQTATIDDGAKLTVTNENGRYFEWKEFEILNANDVTGTFTYDGTVADYDASRIDVALDYSDPTKVLLTAKRKATDYEHGAVPAAEGLSRNQKEVAHAMDSVSTGFGGDITNALLQLEKLGGLNPEDVTLINPNSTLKSALSDMTGVLYANSALLTLFNSKTSHVYDRIAKRNPSTGSCPTCHDNVWVEYYNQHDKVYADANSPRFTNNMNGVLVGYDRSSEDVLLGVYTGYSKSDMRQSADTMDIEDTTLGVYAGWRPGDWIFKGTLYGGYQSYEGERHIEYMNRTATGAYKGWNLALDLEGAYNVPVYSWLNVKPFVGALANYAYQQSFTEKGADSLNLHVASKDLVNTQARFGVQFDGKIQNKLSWYGSVAVKQFIGNDYAKLRMTMGLPGTRMEIISAELGRTYFSGQVGLNYAFNNNWSMFGNLDMGVNNKSTNCYGNIGVAYTW